jgi:hypothetical protein
MAKGMESNVSDDESDTTSLNDLVELVHEQKGMLEKQANEIKELNALNDLSTPLLQIMNICCANSNCLARSVMRLKQVIPLSLIKHLSLVQFLYPR